MYTPFSFFLSLFSMRGKEKDKKCCTFPDNSRQNWINNICVLINWIYAFTRGNEDRDIFLVYDKVHLRREPRHKVNHRAGW